MNDVSQNCQTICHKATTLLATWENAQELKQAAPISQINGLNVTSAKSSLGRYKCNFDASFCEATNRVGIRMCIRDTEGAFVLART